MPKILIVDDNQQNVDLLVYFLKPQQYDLVTATNGEQALELIEKEKPDIILLDIMLPGINGFEVCESVKTNSQTRFIPVIMITALKELKDKVKALEVGADDFISKPFENIELLTRVKSLLRIKKYHDQLEATNKELSEKHKELLQMDQFKEELAHLIVHDMKNPLFVIQGNLQMMSMGISQGSTTILKKYVDRIDRSSQNLLRMVMNIIDISKIENGTIDLNREVSSLGELIQKSVKKIKDFPEHLNKTIEVNISPQLPLFSMDSSIMEQVFDNIIHFSASNVKHC